MIHQNCHQSKSSNRTSIRNIATKVAEYGTYPSPKIRGQKLKTTNQKAVLEKKQVKSFLEVKQLLNVHLERFASELDANILHALSLTVSSKFSTFFLCPCSRLILFRIYFLFVACDHGCFIYFFIKYIFVEANSSFGSVFPYNLLMTFNF